ncbi:MAG: hypothetical protein P8Y10_03180 [Gemmatimonadales bacterium]
MTASAALERPLEWTARLGQALREEGVRCTILESLAACEGAVLLVTVGAAVLLTVGAALMIGDLNGRRRAEARLRASEERFRTLAANERPPRLSSSDFIELAPRKKAESGTTRRWPAPPTAPTSAYPSARSNEWTSVTCAA